jgi:hypothetical protein
MINDCRCVEKRNTSRVNLTAMFVEQKRNAGSREKGRVGEWEKGRVGEWESGMFSLLALR